MNQVMNISIFITSSTDSVYKFTSNPLNLPRWASGLALSSVRQVDDHWEVEAPFGKVKVRFAPHNSFGVLES